ncbi:hypothetical protein BDN71DRAFT_1444947, partial [Pleurotus eryngii]
MNTVNPRVTHLHTYTQTPAESRHSLGREYAGLIATQEDQRARMTHIPPRCIPTSGGHRDASSYVYIWILVR